MKYDFKLAWEIGWAVMVAAGVFALEVLVRFDPDTILDWRSWLVALLGGCVRAGAGAALGVLTKPKR